MKINLDKTIRAMSIALDLVELSSMENAHIIDEISKINYSNHKFLHHSIRSTYIALELGTLLNLDEKATKSLYISTLIHDIGAASSLNKSHHSGAFIKSHCINGATIMEHFPNIEAVNNLSHIILYHHENWDGSGEMQLSGNKIPIESQIIRIADSVEILFSEDASAFIQKEKIIEWITSKRNLLFSKEIVEAFLALAKKDIFWLNLSTLPYMPFILDQLAPNLDIYLTLDEFTDIANIFASIIDTKSKFTASHSREIAKLAYKVSEHLGYSDEKCTKMKIAGLLHDIGKLAIPIHILDKNGSLTDEEFSIIKSHAYYTKTILDRIEDIPDITNWACSHHEKLNATGYPRSLQEEEICQEAKILGVCDIYQALTEDRPYRKGLTIERAFSILESMVEDKFVCNTAVSALKDTLSFKSETKTSMLQSLRYNLR